MQHIMLWDQEILHNLIQELYDNYTLLHDSYEPGLAIKFCFNKNPH